MFSIITRRNPLNLHNASTTIPLRRHLSHQPPIVHKVGHPSLRVRSRPIRRDELTTPEFKTIISEMNTIFDQSRSSTSTFSTLRQAFSMIGSGIPPSSIIGLSAPQIGRNVRVIAIEIHESSIDTIRDRFRHHPNFVQASKKDEKNKRVKALNASNGFLVEPVPLTFIVNPEMTYLELNKHKWIADYEGCESVPFYNALVKRCPRIKVKGWTLEGEEVERVCEGFLARIIQHEMDHLDGKLFLDRMEPGTLRHDDYIDKYDQFVRL